MRELQASIGENQGQMSEKIRRHENLSGANEQRRRLQLEEMLQGYVPNEEIRQEVQEQLKKRSGQSLKNQKNAELAALSAGEQEKAETLRTARNRYIFAYPSSQFNGSEKVK